MWRTRCAGLVENDAGKRFKDMQYAGVIELQGRYAVFKK